MSTPWFFLSYSSADDRERACVAEFYEDLVDEVRRKGALKGFADTKVGFLDGADIDVGAEWDTLIAQALQTSRTLVCLYSPTYFKSKYCMRELEIFLSRLDAYKNDADPERPPRRIFPVLWENPNTLPQNLPGGLARIQNRHKDLGSEYAQKGLFYLKKTRKDVEYNNFLESFAGGLVREAEQGFLPHLPNPPSLVGDENESETPPDDTRAAGASRDVLAVLADVDERQAAGVKAAKAADDAAHGLADVADSSGTTHASSHLPAFNQGVPPNYPETAEATPPVPSDLSASAVSPSQIDLAWTDNSGRKGGFEIERRQVSGSQAIAHIMRVGAGVISYKDTGLKAGTSYTYRVRAFNRGGLSDYSKVAQATTLWPLWLKIVVSVVALLVASFVIFLVVKYWPTDNKGINGHATPTPAHSPISTPTPFTELFRPAKANVSSGSKWDGSNIWFVPEQWDRWGDSTLAGWLVVKGTTPGGVKDMKFRDSVVRFRIEFVKGSKVGWMMLTQADAQGVRGGYCFILEKQAEKQPFKFSAYDCQTSEAITLDKNEVGITQYKKEGDFIQVEAVIKNNQFQFYFKLKNNEEDESSDESRGNTKQCYPVTAMVNSDVHPDGSTGLFAGDNDTEFRVSKFAVYPLTEEYQKLALCAKR